MAQFARLGMKLDIKTKTCIALFSDIHANLPAFEAMLADMDEQQPDAVYCLGDLVGYHIWPNEVIAEIRTRDIATLKGNHDEKVEGVITTPESLNEQGKDFAYHIIGEEERAYLANLPPSIKVDFKFESGDIHALLAHGSPRSIDEYVLVDTDETYILKMMEEAGADLLFVGHSHKPYHRILKGLDGKFKHLVNIGSVGKPKDGDPRSCYVMLAINEQSSLTDKDSIQVEFRRVVYDVEMSARAIEDSLLPDELATALRMAR